MDPLFTNIILVHYGQPCIYIIWVILRTNILDVLNGHDIKILINIYKPITDSYYIVIYCFPWEMVTDPAKSPRYLLCYDSSFNQFAICGTAFPQTKRVYTLEKYGMVSHIKDGKPSSNGIIGDRRGDKQMNKQQSHCGVNHTISFQGHCDNYWLYHNYKFYMFDQFRSPIHDIMCCLSTKGL